VETCWKKKKDTIRSFITSWGNGLEGRLLRRGGRLPGKDRGRVSFLGTGRRTKVPVSGGQVAVVVAGKGRRGEQPEDFEQKN